MSEKIKLVQGSTLPDLEITLFDKNNNNAPIDLSLGKTVTVAFSAVGDSSNIITMPTTFATDGKDGKVIMQWDANALLQPGAFEAEITINAGDRKQIVYDILQFTIRPSLQQ